MAASAKLEKNGSQSPALHPQSRILNSNEKETTYITMDVSHNVDQKKVDTGVLIL